MHIKKDGNKLIIMHETEFEADALDDFFGNSEGGRLSYFKRRGLSGCDMVGYVINRPPQEDE